MWTHRTTALAVGLSLSICVTPLPGQIDYRNLDQGRPVATEDAYPVERYAFELLVPFSGERERGGDDVYLVPLEIEYGIFDNAEIGLGLPLSAADGPGDTQWGVAGLELSALYNFNTEGPALPALSLAADLSLPVGSLAGSEARVSLTGIATRSWGRTRLHFNAVRSFGSENAPGIEPAPRWSYSLALDRTLYRRSLLFVGEVLAQRVVRSSPVEMNAAVGVRYQLSPTFVLDLGLARRLRSRAGPDYHLTIGLSHAFGFAWLMPGKAR